MFRRVLPKKKMKNRKVVRRQIIYLKEGIEIDYGNRRLYDGKLLVRVNKKKLQRAYEILPTITDQHLRVGAITNGVSHQFRYRGGVCAYVFGPESADSIRHIKFDYDSALPLLELVSALGLPSPIISLKDE